MSRDSSELHLSLGALSSRERGRPFGLATAAGLSAGRLLPSQPPLLLARGECRSVRQKSSRAQRARKLARAFWWGARSGLASPPGLEALRSGVDTDLFLERVPKNRQPDPFVNTKPVETPRTDNETYTECRPVQPDSSSDKLGSVVCVRDPSLCTKHVCELERKQRWVDHRMSGTSCDSRMWNPCDDDHLNTGHCTGDSGAIAEVASSTAMDDEELFYNVDVNANGDDLITDCTGDFDVTGGVPGSADTHSIPSHGIETGRKGETGCGARSSRDGFTADPECDGTHYNFPATLESGEAIEDRTKDEVEQLVVMREVVDDEFWCSRTQHHDVAADDSDSDEGGMEALVHGSLPRYATACSNRSVIWPRVRPRSLPAERYSDNSCDSGLWGG